MIRIGVGPRKSDGRGVYGNVAYLAASLRWAPVFASPYVISETYRCIPVGCIGTQVRDCHGDEVLTPTYCHRPRLPNGCSVRMTVRCHIEVSISRTLCLESCRCSTGQFADVQSIITGPVDKSLVYAKIYMSSNMSIMLKLDIHRTKLCSSWSLRLYKLARLSFSLSFP